MTQQQDTSSQWIIEADRIDPARYFGAMVANGMIGLIGDSRPLYFKEIVLNGVYDRYQRGRVSNILKGFNPLNVDLSVNGHHLSADSLTQYRQQLNMRSASFNSLLENPQIKVVHSVAALRQLPFTALVDIEITAREDLSFSLSNQLEAPDHLREVKQLFSEIDRPHVKIPLLTSTANSPGGSIQLAAANSFLFEEAHGSEPDLIHEDWDFNRHLVKFTKSLRKGESYRFGILSSMCTSVHFSDPMNEAERLSIYAKMEGRERLLKRHREEWATLWKSDIRIEGAPRVQREVRLMLYYLYASVRAGTALSISPVGLSGLGYNGHVFWDTELWMYPPLLILRPELAKSLLDYRYDRLEAARQNAFSHGFKGAMFPWESADDGTEQTPVWALTGPFQQHITACVGWAFWKYYQVTRDLDWLREKGFEVLREVAAFWCSRVERNGPGQYDITNVIGANEFEENIDNNAFTNAIVVTVLKYAARAAETLGLPPDPDWLQVAENIRILQFPDGTTRENATYEGAVIKQADVNLLAHPLYHITDREQLRKDLEYYGPRMSPDGPAMGLATIATLHAQLGDADKAYELFIQSYRSNGLPPFGLLAECAGGKGISPYFTTGAGGALQALLFGFGGIRITDDGIVRLEETPLPSAIRSLQIDLG